LEVCGELGVEPQRCAYVGDGGSDELRGGRELGMTAVLFRHAREIDLEGLPDGARNWQEATIERLLDIWTALGV
jgi:FMN phosphatase YigB (HAD superfamily)